MAQPARNSSSGTSGGVGGSERRASTRATGADASHLRDLVTAAVGDQYLIGEEIGRGGMAVVYSATDVRLQRPVALKVLPPEFAFREDIRERFVREAQTAARLNHPHIVQIFAVHDVSGVVCFSMALIRGESLAARIHREPAMPAAEVARILEQVADALAYAHASGVVHRDIKPDNVLFDRDTGRMMLTDFGIARAVDGGSRLTQTGIAVGTPAFMSPEQALGDREIDGRSDIYSVGILGYLMLAGRLPFDSASTPTLLLKHVNEPPPALASLRAGIPTTLSSIVERCLAKRPDERWPSALALRDALRHVQRDGSLSGGAVASSQPAFVPGVQAVRAVPAALAVPVVPAAPVAPATWDPQYPPVAPHSGMRPLSPAESPGSDSDQKFKQITRRIRKLRRSSLGAGVSALILVMLVVMSASGVGFLAELTLLICAWMLPIFGIMALWHSFKLKRQGISPIEALGSDWEQLVRVPPARVRGARIEQLLSRAAAGIGSDSRYFDLVRRSADDLVAIEDITSRLGPEDRKLVPEAVPTAERLLDHVGSLAAALDQLERDLPEGSVADLQSRLARLEMEPGPVEERERRRLLLEHQLESVQQLVVRRDAIRAQLDRGVTALRTLRLDLVRLSTMGVGGSHAERTSVTQEVQALSRDLGIVIDAVTEARKM